MTSFSTAESPESKAELFSLPADQMSHIQVVTVEQGPLPRTLRLTGAVEYNDFKTTPVITQVGGPVSRVVVVQGEHVRAGQALLYVASPDYSLLRVGLSQGTRRLPARGQVLSSRAGSLRAPRHRPGRSRTGGIEPHAGAGGLRVQRRRHPHPRHRRSRKRLSPNLPHRKFRCTRRWLERWWTATCSPGQLLAAGATQCFTLSDMSSVWILVNIYQNDVAYVHVGDPVTIEQ